jgi:UDP-sulfoquinovose synthase
LHFSARGHRVAVADNYLRRRLQREENVEPLRDLPNLLERCRAWQAASGHTVTPFIGDLCRWDFISSLFRSIQPDVVVHYAEQPSAPYSMLRRDAALLTIQNNLDVTANVIFAVREFSPQTHIIKLGTMGEYGTPNIDIEEGWIDIQHKGRKDRFLYPRQAGSLYHTTKIMDTDLLWFYVRNWGLRVTDLMQGPVYGILTDETEGNQDLYPHFSYDELFGTVLNRFVVQAVIGHPLTVYGQGGQTRGFLNLKDTLNCVRLAAENPPKTGEFKIFNQFTETFSVRDLAALVVRAGRRMDLDVKVTTVTNPRKEKEEHYYNPVHTGLISLGLKPHYLSEDVLVGMMTYVAQHAPHIHQERIYRGVRWD